jgi:uncharacterized protein YacL
LILQLFFFVPIRLHAIEIMLSAAPFGNELRRILSHIMAAGGMKMDEISLAVAIAVIVEAIMEYVKSGYEAIAAKNYDKVIYYAVALILSLLFCFAGKVDILTPLGVTIGPEWVGIVLTAVLASRGASYLRSIIAKIES